MDFLYNNFLSDFFSICMNGLNSLFADYALCIVILTILIRLCLLPLDLKMRSNSAKMSALGPEIQSIQKRYANNPQIVQKKQQELYRKMNVKPMFGCLPSLIQLPILFAFFGAMRVLQSQQTVALMLDAAQYGASTVQLPEFFWVHNFWQPDNGMSNILPNSTEFLSFIQQNSLYITPQTMSLLQTHGLLDFSTGVMTVPDATYTALTTQILQSNGFINAAGEVTNYNGYFILPALAGVALFLQQKFNPASMNGGMGMNAMNPAGGGSEQAEAAGCSSKMMLWIFPIFSIWICATSNTAFALYWFISSLYAFAQMKLVDVIKKARAKKKEVSVV